MAKRTRTSKEEQKEGKKKKKSIEDTDAWNAADWDYSGLIAGDMMPLLNPPLTGKKRINYLKEILKDCPEYYPASLEAGYRMIQENIDKEGKKYIDRGLDSLKKHFSMKDLREAYYRTCEILEERLRFEMAVEYYNQIKEIEENKAKVYGYLTYCHVYLDEPGKAFESQKKAIELSDSNPKFYCSMGWVEMIRGNLNAAKTVLEKSLELDPNDTVTKNNYGACTEMLKKGLKNWEEFLLRNMDYEYLEELEEEDEQKYEKEIREYNSMRFEAFKLYIMRNTDYSIGEKYDIIFTLGYILNLIWDENNGWFSYDDIIDVEAYFEAIMHKFIIKTGDVDREIFDDTCNALLEFYKFLEKKEVISGCKSLERQVKKLKPKLIKKMLKYNEVRHNDDYTKDEKDETCEELFGMDVFWPLM